MPPQPGVAEWSVYGPLGLIVVVLLGALAWMTRGRFADRDSAASVLAERDKAHANTEREVLQKTLTVTHEQSRATDAHTAALQEMAAAIRQQASAVDRNTEALNGILREVVRDAVRQPPRRTISDSAMAQVRDLQREGKERGR